MDAPLAVVILKLYIALVDWNRYKEHARIRHWLTSVYFNECVNIPLSSILTLPINYVYIHLYVCVQALFQQGYHGGIWYGINHIG